MKVNPRFEVFTGPMFGGKTTRLLSALERYQYQNKNVILFKPKIDTRYSKDSVVTHGGIKWNSKSKSFNKVIRVDSSKELFRYFKVFNSEHDIDVVAVDEVFMIENVAEVLIEIYKIQVDDDDNEEICKIYKVESVPSFFLMKDKKCINDLKGADMKGIKKMLNIKD